MSRDDLVQALEAAQAICRERGGRLTLQRRTVLAALLGAHGPMSAYDLLELLRPGDPALTPASTYRSLDFLVEMGLAHRLETTRSFLACRHPEHLHASQFLIRVDHRTVELTGLCGSCGEAGEPPRS